MFLVLLLVAAGLRPLLLLLEDVLQLETLLLYSPLLQLFNNSVSVDSKSSVGC